MITKKAMGFPFGLAVREQGEPNEVRQSPDKPGKGQQERGEEKVISHGLSPPFGLGVARGVPANGAGFFRVEKVDRDSTGNESKLASEHDQERLIMDDKADEVERSTSEGDVFTGLPGGSHNEKAGLKEREGFHRGGSPARRWWRLVNTPGLFRCQSPVTNLFLFPRPPAPKPNRLGD